uniref:Uncharacterized protein n=1 Tax=Glossina brevipalpis TaxID=37001 RepID=A0A1A9X4P4_9MUSC
MTLFLSIAYKRVRLSLSYDSNKLPLRLMMMMVVATAAAAAATTIIITVSRPRQALKIHKIRRLHIPCSWYRLEKPQTKIHSFRETFKKFVRATFRGLPGINPTCQKRKRTTENIDSVNQSNNSSF